MFAREQVSNTERNLRVLGGVLASTGALAVAGCGNDNEKAVYKATTTEQVATSEATQPTTTMSDRKKAKLIFDGLGGSEPVIMVYKGVGDTSSAKKHTGTFYSGDTAVAQCKTEGRTVQSDPASGESERSSDDWIRVEKSPDPTDTAYATAVYVEHPHELLEKLPECK